MHAIAISKSAEGEFALDEVVQSLVRLTDARHHHAIGTGNICISGTRMRSARPQRNVAGSPSRIGREGAQAEMARMASPRDSRTASGSAYRR